MAVVKLVRGEDVSLVLVGDIYADKRITDEEAKQLALDQANGTRDDFLDHEEGGWEADGVYPDEQFQELRNEHEVRPEPEEVV